MNVRGICLQVIRLCIRISTLFVLALTRRSVVSQQLLVLLFWMPGNIRLLLLEERFFVAYTVFPYFFSFYRRRPSLCRVQYLALDYARLLYLLIWFPSIGYDFLKRRQIGIHLEHPSAHPSCFSGLSESSYYKGSPQ